MHNSPAGTLGSGPTAAGPPGQTSKPGLKERAFDEGKKLLIMTLYLWVFLALLDLHKTAILREHHLNYPQQGFAIVNALVLAKFMLVADDLKIGTRFSARPLIYPVLHASLVFTVILLCFHILEGALVAVLHGRPATEALAELGGGIWQGVLTYGAIAFVALIPFFLFRNIARAVGEAALWRLVFTQGGKHASLVVQE